MASRELNHCEEFRYSWYPRGHNRSAQCPKCKSSQVITESELQLRLEAIVEQRKARLNARQALFDRIKSFGYGELVSCPVCNHLSPVAEILKHYDQKHMGT